MKLPTITDLDERYAAIGHKVKELCEEIAELKRITSIILYENKVSEQPEITVQHHSFKEPEPAPDEWLPNARINTVPGQPELIFARCPNDGCNCSHKVHVNILAGNTPIYCQECGTVWKLKKIGHEYMWKLYKGSA